MAHLLSCFYVLVTDDPGFLQMACKCSRPLMTKCFSVLQVYLQKKNGNKTPPNTMAKEINSCLPFNTTKSKCIPIFIK